ncbi:hypothetical protein AAFP30_18365 [Gordonia sp. CPCC 205515]|uniref:hypothetical protein n=1 Tax=Gordonia sp. CPCC 205515 TaxID=3140791 RepID=UPI003AF38E03
MRDPNSAIPTEAQPKAWRRYDEWRAERHLRFNQKHAHQMTGWRNRRGYRRLVRWQIANLLIGLVAAVIAFSTYWFWIPFLIAVLGCIACQYCLRIVTGSVADTPVPALDEIQLAQRNSARSIGFTTLYTLMFIPYIVLIILSTRDQVSGQSVYGTAILLVILVLAGTLLPTMLTAWWMSDPDPEDVATPNANGDAHE